MPMGVTRAALANRRNVHGAQNARRIALQHLNNNHPGATAKDSQAPLARHCCARHRAEPVR